VRRRQQTCAANSMINRGGEKQSTGLLLNLPFTCGSAYMPNIAGLLKTEISRIARRESRSQTASLQKASAAYRREIAALKRRLSELERATRSLDKRPAKPTVSPEATDKLRFRADGFRSMRKKLGLSAGQMAKLLGVSAQSVYGWEQKRSTPRRSQLPAIAAVRAMGKREALARLGTL